MLLLSIPDSYFNSSSVLIALEGVALDPVVKPGK